MARVRPSIAGRQVPIWAATLVRLLFLAALVGIGWRIVQLQAASSAPTVPAAVRAAAPTPQRASAIAAPAPVPALRRLALDRELVHGEYVWNDAGVPPGRVTVHVDLATETVSVVRAGHEIGRAVILYGTDENPTPLGSFNILEKDIDHESNIYEAAMPYMLRLTNDGIAIHGSEVVLGRASRGCIGVPDEFAALLFAQARVGDRVTIVRSAPAAEAQAERTAAW